jgi:hypothetical protein
MASASIQTLEIYRSYFTFLLSTRNYTESLALATRMCQLFEAHGSESSMCKCMAAVTIIQLTLGDIVLADRTFLQSHLSVPNYIKSFECALAEEFIQAVKEHDAERLEAAQKSHRLSYLDRDIQVLARKLSVYKPKEKKALVAAASAPAVVVPPAAPIATTTNTTEEGVVDEHVDENCIRSWNEHTY